MDIPPLTVSFGMAIAQPGDSVEVLTKRADRALYQAKRLGRNRTCMMLEIISLAVPRLTR
ncbi:MAG: diguanylate cyclase [Cyanobacteria bacterium J06638_20]